MPYVAELNYYDPATGTTAVARFAQGPGFAPTDAGIDWIPPGLVSWGSPTQKVAISQTGSVSLSTDKGLITIGNVPLSVTQAGPYDALVDKIYQGRTATLYWLQNKTWASRVVVDTGVLETPIPAFSLGSSTTTTITYPLRDPRSALSGNLQPTLYAGTNANALGVEGVATDLQGKPKPILYGRVSNIPGVLVNTSLLIYQLADQPVAIECVRDGGVSAITGGVVRSSLASMQATAPAKGTYDVYTGSEGSFVRLGSQPQYTVTFDAAEGANDAARTTAQVWSRVRQARCGTAAAGIEAASVTAADGLDSGVVGFWWSDQMTQQDALDEVLSGFSGVEVMTVASLWRIVKLKAPAAGATTQVDLVVLQPGTRLTSKARSLESAALARPDYAPDGAPPYQVNVQWGKNYTVMSSSDFAGAAPATIIAKFEQEYRTATSTALSNWNPATQTGPWINAPSFTMESGYQADVNNACAPAVAEAARLLTLCSVMRKQWTVSYPASVYDSIVPGDTVSLTMGSYGLSAGALFTVLQSSLVLDDTGLTRSLIIGLQRLSTDP